MKLEQQVVTLEQAKRLKELGVFENAFASWVFDPLNERWDLSKLNVEQLQLVNPDKEAYPAFTVAELGVMLPDLYISGYASNKTATCCHYKEADKQRNVKEVEKWQGKGNTEAEARAAMLIYLLENGHTTAEEVNQRLTA